jgi:hypothetical protein
MANYPQHRVASSGNRALKGVADRLERLAGVAALRSVFSPA